MIRLGSIITIGPAVLLSFLCVTFYIGSNRPFTKDALESARSRVRSVNPCYTEDSSVISSTLPLSKEHGIRMSDHPLDIATARIGVGKDTDLENQGCVHTRVPGSMGRTRDEKTRGSGSMVDHRRKPQPFSRRMRKAGPGNSTDIEQVVAGLT